MTNYIKKNYKSLLYDSIIIILNFIILLSYFLQETISNLDEIWNFNTARQIMNGLIPYKEISMITTPLLPTINAMILKLFGDELIVFRVTTALLSTLILFVSYKIICEITKNKIYSTLATETILLMYTNYFFLDYNFFSLLLLLIIEFMELKLHNSKSRKINILIGLISGLAICTKQTIGVIISIFVAFEPIINLKEADIKERIRISIIRIIGMCIPTILFVTYLLINGALDDFIDYAILGIKYFDNNISYRLLFENKEIYIKVLAIIIPISIIIMIVFEYFFNKSKKRIYKSKQINKMNILVIYSFPMLITMYPIADGVHFLIGILPIKIVFEILFFMSIKEVYEKLNIENKKYIISLIMISITLIIFIKLIILQTINNYKSYNQANKSQLEHYSKVPTNNLTEERIQRINDFYNEKRREGIDNIIIVDASAAIYNITANKYNKNYDMFLKGNIGKEGEKGIIKNISESNNCIYLIKNEKLKLNWQTPLDVIKFIRENLAPNGSVDIFDIYYQKTEE